MLRHKNFFSSFVKSMRGFDQTVVEVPAPVIETLEHKLGLTIDPKMVTEIAGDGYEHEKHGTWRAFAYQRQKLCLIVRLYADGFVEIQ
jgi:hypothetical protein